MCIFGKSAPAPAQPTVSASSAVNQGLGGSSAPYSPVRRPGGPVAKMYAKRTQQQKGTMGNIFTSPLGVTERSEVEATKLGSTSTPFNSVKRFGGLLGMLPGLA